LSSKSLPKETERILARFKARLTRRYADAEAYLFGSYACGTWLEDSDLDVVVVSSKFKGQTFVERVAEVRHLAPNHKPFEILAYTPAEFRSALRRSVVLQDARRYWRRVA